MSERNTITREYLRSILNYDPATGVFVWLPRPVRAGFERTDRAWNSRRVGTAAGTVNFGGYVAINLFGIPRYAHRLAFLHIEGWMPEYVDHQDGNRANNAWANLRAATNSLNLANAKLRANNTSGYKGVCWYPPLSQWTARIQVNGRGIHLGYFDQIEDAAKAYSDAASKHFGEFARLS